MWAKLSTGTMAKYDILSNFQESYWIYLTNKNIWKYILNLMKSSTLKEMNLVFDSKGYTTYLSSTWVHHIFWTVCWYFARFFIAWISVEGGKSLGRTNIWSCSTCEKPRAIDLGKE